MFRRKDDDIEVLLAHPGGPFFVHKDDEVWTIPKGEAGPGEDLLTRAQIEFEEELGFRPENEAAIRSKLLIPSNRAWDSCTC